MKLLTVIVPTIPPRASLLGRLLWHLGQDLDDRAEVLVMDGPAGLGVKVEQAVQLAHGRMSVVIDDDDLVPDDYTHTICDVLEEHDVDFVGYRILRTIDNEYRGSFSHDLNGDVTWVWPDRGVSPKCPFRTSLAVGVPFRDDYCGDRFWSEQMHFLCRSGVFIDRHLYRSDEWTGTSTFKGDQHADVGDWPHDPSRFRWWSRGGI
jgi:hypothetical protein